MNKITILFYVFALIMILFLPELGISHEDRPHQHGDGEVVTEPNPNYKGLVYGLMSPIILIDVFILLTLLPLIISATSSAKSRKIIRVAPLALFTLLFATFGTLSNLGIITKINLFINDNYLISFSLFIIGLFVILRNKIPLVICLIPIILISIISGTQTGMELIGKEENILFAIGFLASIMLIEGFGQFLAALANRYKPINIFISILAAGICILALYISYIDYTEFHHHIINSAG